MFFENFDWKNDKRKDKTAAAKNVAVFCFKGDGFMELIVLIVLIIGFGLFSSVAWLLGFSLLWVLILGGVFLLLFYGIVKLFIVPYFENRKTNRLNDDHILIYPQKQRVRVDTHTVINGINPYVIDCFYTDEKTGKEFCFTSKQFTFDPSPYINAPLPVFTNPVDYSNYYVDTSSIPEK